MPNCIICTEDKEDLVLVECQECKQSSCINCFDKLDKCPFCRYIDFNPIDIQTYYDKNKEKINDTSNDISDDSDDYQISNAQQNYQLQRFNNRNRNINKKLDNQNKIKDQIIERYKFSKPYIKRLMYLKYDIPY